MDKKTILTLLAIILFLSYVIKLVFDYIEVPFYKYGIFLYWIIAIGLLILVLPQKAGELFSN